MIRISGLEVTGDRCKGEHSVRSYVRDFVGAIHGKACHVTQTPITTLESRGAGQLGLGEASLTPTVSRGAYGFTR